MLHVKNVIKISNSLYPPGITSNFIKHLFFSTDSEDILIYYSKTKITPTHNLLKSRF